jgi:outer membrane protein assembly factor BamB
MKRCVFAVIVAGWVYAMASAGAIAGEGDSVWPAWRGPQADGVAPAANPPVEWSESKNVRWKIELPGDGLATPIVWGDFAYIQAAIKTERKAAEPQGDARANPEALDAPMGEASPASFVESNQPPPDRRRDGRRGEGRRGRQRKEAPTHIHEFVLLAIERATGNIAWRKALCEERPHESLHPDSTQASNSPITDGQHIYAYFGSRGLYSVDLDGHVKWKKDFGDMQTRNSFGEGSSPALHGDTIVINWDHEGDSFIVALDKQTGRQRWKVDRDEPTSWSTPVIVESGGKPQVITAASNFVRAYDLATGDLVWQCAGLTNNVITSPVAADGMVFVMSSRGGSAVLAIRYEGAAGDITDSDAVVWRHDKDTPYVSSPLLYGEKLYFLKSTNGILSCFDTTTGKALFDGQRLEGIDGVYASPVGAADRVYIVGRGGKTVVLTRGETFEPIATNALDDQFDASPAIAGNEIYLRGRKQLYCIAEAS